MKFEYILLVISQIYCLNANKILLFPTRFESGQLIFTRIGKELVRHGHNVTLLVGDKKHIIPELRKTDISVRKFLMENISSLDSPEIESFPVRYAFASGVIEKWNFVKIVENAVAEEGALIFKDRMTVEQLGREEFDFLLVDSAHGMMLAHKLSVPFGYVGADIPSLIRRIPYLPSFVPMFSSDHSDNMSLGERFLNFLQFFANDLSTRYALETTELSKQVAPELPAISAVDLFRRAALVFKLGDIALESPRPGMPDLIPTGHLLTSPGDALPKQQKEILQKSKGAILISFGSAGEHLPRETLAKFLRVLSNVEHDVIFKCKTMPKGLDIPENVHILPNVRQNDLLAHQKLKLIISHCDSISMVESIFHRKPMLAFPLAENQHANAAYMTSRLLGKTMDITTFVEAELEQNIHDILANETFRQNLHKAGEIIRDMQNSNVSNPAFWIEHVVKYGSDHLRSHAYNLPLYQYLMLDAIALMLFFTIALVVVVYPILKAWCACYKWSCMDYKNIGRIN